ncbi:MAG: M3 family metallopeptidase [Ignavibacteria bacterium]|nr:MAG: M3 family metallopeptidase [Ignavibacteria bacterium]
MLLFTGSLIITSCGTEETNPLLAEWDTPFETPPFDKIKNEHFLPAFNEAMKEHNLEIDAIINNPDAATFENTIVALDHSGSLLKRVDRVFSAIRGAMTNEEVQKISKEVSPMLSKHEDDITLNADLFKRVKQVYAIKESLGLNSEQNKLLDHYYKNFVRGGANLDNDAQEELRKMNEELSLLSLRFGENVLKETNKFELIIDNEDDLEGLPVNTLTAAAETANEKGYNNKWVFTIQKPSMLPFLRYSKKRELREKIYRAYYMKGDNNDDLDNKKILSRVAMLRLKRARLLGFKTHANYVLEEQMAQNPENVYDLLNKLWTPALNRAKEEREEMQQIIIAEGNNFKLEPWDWWYYAEKLKKAKYDMDEDEITPYFQVENVIDGVFGLATSLWGITFEERNDISKYHPDVKVFEVKEADGTHIGILYTDYFPRASKRAGAWMNSFQKQFRKDGKMIYPIIYNVGNFTKPTGDTPALLSMDNVETLFHEFGHALHGLLSNSTYESLSGTDTPRDFVEFPSQVMENWAKHPDVLITYAKHYKTGKVIPAELIEKIQNASLFNQGFKTVEYLAASILDMDWHTITDTIEYDAIQFENKSMEKIRLMPEIIPRYRSTYFNHIFSGGYSSGYYSYIWAEVLDADAFNAFVETGDILNKELAARYRKYILSSGGTDDSMELYKKFRGKDPDIKPLLERRGLN